MTNRNGTILVVVPSLGIGGQERIAINTVDCFQDLGYHVIFVIFQRREKEYPFEGKLIDLNVPTRKSKIGKIIAQIKRSRKLSKLRKEYCAKWVYSLGRTANISNVLSGISGYGKSIISLRVFEEVKKGFINNYLYSKAYRVVCVAQDMEQELLIICPKLRNTVVIENGQNFHPFIMEQKGSPVMAASPRLVTIGRLDEQKGFDRLIRGMKLICKKLPDAVLTIIGKGTLQTELATLVKEQGLERVIDFRGYLADPFPVLQEHNIYVMTSYQEGFPNSLVEALACGLPVIAADCRSGPREILSEQYAPEPIQGIHMEKYGVLVENTSEGFEERFAEAVVQLWNNPEKRELYRSAGPERAKDFSLERYRDNLGKLLGK